MTSSADTPRDGVDPDTTDADPREGRAEGRGSEAESSQLGFRDSEEERAYHERETDASDTYRPDQ